MKKLFCLMVILLTGCATTSAVPDTTFFRDQLKKHTLIVYKEGKTSFYDERGIQPLLLRLNDGTFKNAFVADRIIGKAAALLHVYGQVKEVYSPVISKPAITVYKKYGVKYTADNVIDNIRNRKNTGLCPMEMKVKEIDDPKQAYLLFTKK